MILCLFAAPMGLSAQVLVFHLPDGGMQTVEMPATFTFSASGDKIIVDGASTHIELFRDRILAMTYRPNRGDSNADMKVDVADIATIISIMAGKEDGNDPEPGPTPDPEPTPLDRGKAPANVEAVDLGLPSGTLWANMNLGATDVPDAGLYYAWGETTGYKANTSDGRKFNWATYKWMQSGKSDWQYVNKYQVDDGQYQDSNGNDTGAIWYKMNWSTGKYEFIGDGKTVLDPEDDAAQATWGGDWHIPTDEDFKELLANTTSEWVTINSVNFRKFTSTVEGCTDKVLFLPAAGNKIGSSLLSQGTSGEYWSASVSSYSSTSRGLGFGSGYAGTDGYGDNRCFGRSVRPVLKK